MRKRSGVVMIGLVALLAPPTVARAGEWYDGGSAFGDEVEVQTAAGDESYFFFKTRKGCKNHVAQLDREDERQKKTEAKTSRSL
jgi:hypothetical protein